MLRRFLKSVGTQTHTKKAQKQAIKYVESERAKPVNMAKKAEQTKKEMEGKVMSKVCSKCTGVEIGNIYDICKAALLRAAESVGYLSVGGLHLSKKQKNRNVL